MRRIKYKGKSMEIGAIIVIVLFICVIISVKKMSLDVKATEYRDRLEETQNELEEEKERSKEIQEHSAYVQTNKYIEEVARKVLGLVYEDEIIFRSDNMEE